MGLNSGFDTEVSAALDVKGSAERVMVMPVISVAGVAYNPAIVCQGKQTPWRRVNGNIQTLHSFFALGAYIHHRDPAGVDSDIFFTWAKDIIKEIEHLRTSFSSGYAHPKLLLIVDCYAGVQYRTLRVLKENGIIVVGLPSHTSHVLQPLDVTVFGPFKNSLRSELQRIRLVTRGRPLGVFQIAEAIRKAYDSSETRTNIISGFQKTGLWNTMRRTVDVNAIATIHLSSPHSPPDPLVHNSQELHHIKSFMDLVSHFRTKRRSLLSGGVIEKEGTIKLCQRAALILVPKMSLIH